MKTQLVNTQKELLSVNQKVMQLELSLSQKEEESTATIANLQAQIQQAELRKIEVSLLTACYRI